VSGLRPGAKGSRDLKRRPRPQLLTRAELDGRTNAAKAFDRLVASIAADLGGLEACSALEINLIEAYAGVSVQVEALNVRQLLGEAIDLGLFCQCASTLTRIASRLGLRRRPRDVTEASLSDILREADQPGDHGEQPDQGEGQ
jgi:hypothetical protein